MRPTEYLTARLDEDEAWAKTALGWQTGSRHEGQPLDWSIHMRRWSPDNALADIAAKRAIIELAEEASGLDMQVDGEFRVGRRDTIAEPYVGDAIIRALLQPYADRPDFDPAWRVA